MPPTRLFPALVVSVCLGCSIGLQPEPDFDSVDSAGRFIQDETIEIIREEVYSLDKTTNSWGTRAWHGVDSTTVSENGDFGVTFSGPMGLWTIETDVALEASETSWLLFELDQRPAVRLVLEWSGSGQSFSDERSLSLDRADGIRFKSAVYKFQVGSHPLWKGQIAAVRLRCQGIPGVPMTLVRASSGFRSLIPEPGRVLESVWKVELGRELRNGFVALPGKSRLLQSDASSYERFSVSVGLEKTASEPVTFSVLVDHGSGPPEIAVECTLDPELGEGNRWFDLSVDLGRFEQEKLTFSLESNVGDLTQVGTGLAWWGGPRLAGGVADSDRPNIVVFCIDTLRADRMSLYGNSTPTTPELERWIHRSGAIFETVIASAPWTLPSHVSMFSGVSALRHGVNHAVSNTPGLAAWEGPQSIPMMAELLREGGYKSAAFTGGAYLHPRWGFASGFDRYSYWPDRGQSADELKINLGRFRDWAMDEGQPWFAFIHTYEVHDPYIPRREFFEQLDGANPDRGRQAAIEVISAGPENGFRARNRWVFRDGRGPSRPLTGYELETVLPAIYDSHVAYADSQIGGLLNRWTSLGLPRNTIVVVTSDHGQVFGETPDAGHTALHESTIAVPLLLALPDGLGAGRRISGQARLVDLLPTLLDGAGLEVPSSIEGVSLMPAVTGRKPISRRTASSVAASANVGVSLRSPEGLKLLVNDTAWRDADPRISVFDVAHDPEESRALSVDDPAVLKLVRELNDMLRTVAPGLVMIANAAETGGLEIDLEGSMVQQRGIRTLPQNPANLLWRGLNRATLNLSAGKQTELRFELIFGEYLTLTLRSRDEPLNAVSEHKISVISVRDRGPVFLSLEKDVLLERDPDGWTSSSPGVFITWHGSRASGNAKNELDAGLSEQLRALGYLE